MQFPSSRYVSGTRAAGGKGVIKVPLEISSHGGPAAGTSLSGSGPSAGGARRGSGEMAKL